MNKLKTPLRYPGGKSRAVPKLFQYFPDLENYNEFREPFVGGGSVALEVTKRYPDIPIWVNDLYEPLVNFWQQLQMFGFEFQDAVSKLKTTCDTIDKARQLFAISKDKINDEDVSDFERAIAFYIVNKCSFSGLTESSSFSAQASENNFSMRGIERLSEYSKLISNWKITNYSYDYILENHNPRAFVYMDPPYDIKDNLYGHKGSMHKSFDHDKFAEDCNKYEFDMMVSYNSDQLVRERFSQSWWKGIEFAHTYTMRSVGDYMKEQHQRKELILINYEL